MLNSQLLTLMKWLVLASISIIKKDTVGMQVVLEAYSVPKDTKSHIGNLKIYEKQNQPRQSPLLQSPVYHNTDLRLNYHSQQNHERAFTLTWEGSHLHRIPQSGPWGWHSVTMEVSLAQVKDAAEGKFREWHIYARHMNARGCCSPLKTSKHFHEINNFEMFTKTLH